MRLSTPSAKTSRDQQQILLSGLEEHKEVFQKRSESLSLLVALWHAGLVGEYLFEDAARMLKEYFGVSLPQSRNFQRRCGHR